MLSEHCLHIGGCNKPPLVGGNQSTIDPNQFVGRGAIDAALQCRVYLKRDVPKLFLGLPRPGLDPVLPARQAPLDRIRRIVVARS